MADYFQYVVTITGENAEAFVDQLLEQRDELPFTIDASDEWTVNTKEGTAIAVTFTGQSRYDGVVKWAYRARAENPHLKIEGSIYYPQEF